MLPAEMPSIRAARYAKMFIAFPKVSINRSFSFIYGFVVAIVDDSPSHTAENGLDHI